jgi:O-antigen ligase
MVAEKIRKAVAPAYLFACLILGGSAQGAWQNMVLQLLGLAIIAFAAATRSTERFPRMAKPPLYLALVAIAVVVLQLVPLPPGLWLTGGRAVIADGFKLIGRPVPPLAISVAPYDSIGTLYSFIPPLALFCAMTRLRAYEPAWIALALVLGTLAGMLLGVVQVASPGANHWYLYPETNFGSAVGFFANAAHMADLLVITLPFVAAFAALARIRDAQASWALRSVLAVVAVVLIAGIALNGALAGYALAAPVIMASLLIVVRPRGLWRRAIAALAGLALIGSLAALAAVGIGASRLGTNAILSVQSRHEILATTGKAIADNLPWGTGLGSFVSVYPLYENADRVTNDYVVHAHNDYAEIALELGIPGIILMIVFLGWWLAAALAPWRTPGAGPFARAASIASAAVLAHSVVDFPLRTAAIGACFAAFCALLADRRIPLKRTPGDLWATRHVVIR